MATVARNAILHPKDEDIDDLNPDNQNNDNNDDDSCNDMPDSSTLKSANQSNLGQQESLSGCNFALLSLSN